MIKIFNFFLLLLLANSPITIARTVLSLDHWKFHLGEIEQCKLKDLQAIQWTSVCIPHDWAIDQPFDLRLDMQMVQVLEDGDLVPKLRTGRTGALPIFGVGYYHIEIDSTPEMQGKRIRIEFDGAMSLAKVFLNGEYIGEQPYGYVSFAFDLSDKWNYNGSNVILVRLENKPESSRWYSGAGLYRNARLVVTDSICVAHWGTAISTPQVHPESGLMHIQTQIDNFTGRSQKVRLETILLDSCNKIVKTINTTETVPVGGFLFKQNLIIDSPRLWSPDSPNLYTVVSKVFASGNLCDTYETTMGFRSIRFDADKGFFLNDRPVKLKGVCLHHDLGPLGAAINIRALERQLQIMQEMGCNAIRTSHNPPAPELLDLCDKMGFLVQVEAFDEWRMGKNANGYHLYFDEWAERDLQAMIRRDRNHPSVIMWSIGNEVREQWNKNGGSTARMLAEICRKEDPSRPVTAGFSAHRQAIKHGLADAVDLVGFNYKPWDYENIHREYPDLILYGSETASTVSSRGVYKFPAEEKSNPYYEDYQVSSFDLEYPHWASTPDTEFEQQDNCEHILGEFVWTGFDYLGEPTPYNEGTPAKSSYFGIVDLAGMKKDRFYLYQSKWSDKPVLHLLPHWNWEDRLGQHIPVYCYTNYSKVELFVNGKSHGLREKKLTGNRYERYRMMWDDVVYCPGEIKVVAYNDKGNIADVRVIKTAGPSSHIRLTADRNQIEANCKDLSFVTVEILDEKGNLCPRTDNLLFFDIEGPARIRAACNGDPTDQTSFNSSYMRTFNGKLMLVIESGDRPGKVRLHVYGGHLHRTSIDIDIMSPLMECKNKTKNPTL